MRKRGWWNGRRGKSSSSRIGLGSHCRGISYIVVCVCVTACMACVCHHVQSMCTYIRACNV